MSEIVAAIDEGAAQQLFDTDGRLDRDRSPRAARRRSDRSAVSYAVSGTLSNGTVDLIAPGHHPRSRTSGWTGDVDLTLPAGHR